MYKRTFIPALLLVLLSSPVLAEAPPPQHGLWFDGGYDPDTGWLDVRMYLDSGNAPTPALAARVLLYVSVDDVNYGPYVLTDAGWVDDSYARWFIDGGLPPHHWDVWRLAWGHLPPGLGDVELRLEGRLYEIIDNGPNWDRPRSNTVQHIIRFTT